MEILPMKPISYIKLGVLLSLALVFTFLTTGCVSRRVYLAKDREVKITKQQMDRELDERQRIIRRLLSVINERIEAGDTELAGSLEHMRAELESTQTQLDSAKEMAHLKDQELVSTQRKLQNIEEFAKAREREVEELRRTYEAFVNDLQGEIKRGEIRIERLGRGLSLHFIDRILFNSGRAAVSPRGKEVLAKVGRILKNVREKDIQVQGHTDDQKLSSKSKYATNWELSAIRATNVTRFLNEKQGVDAARLSLAGYSMYRPVSSNATALGRRKNRRIEIILFPMDSKTPGMPNITKAVEEKATTPQPITVPKPKADVKTAKEIESIDEVNNDTEKKETEKTEPEKMKM